MANTLHDLLYNLVVTSEIRRRKSAEELAEMLRPLGGRHLSVTPTMYSTSTASNRKEEIRSWLATHPTVRYSLTVDGSPFMPEPSIMLPLRGGMTTGHLKKIWPWIVRHGGEVSFE